MPSIEWVDVEVSPVDQNGSDPWPLIERDVENRLTVPMRAMLVKIVDEPDEWSCQANGCALPGAYPPGAASVGYVLDDDDDSPTRGLHWRWTTLIQHDGNVIAVCEDCTPTNVYDKATS